jgi:medium-chain acyl-[acyl-carrier-protein] hydrolase
MNIYEDKIHIKPHHLGYNGFVKISTIFNFLQDLAASHAEKLGFSIHDLMKQSMTWILSRSHLIFFRFPRWNDLIIGKTWPSGRNGKFALRDFELVDKSGKRIGAATTSWMLVDLKNKRSIKLESILDSVSIHEKRALEDEFPAIPTIKTFENECSFKVRISDLDVNKHVNNVVYVDWALDAVNKDILFKYQTTEFEIGYRAESFYGDTVLSRSQIKEYGKELVIIHQLVREGDGKELARLRTKWVALPKQR